MSIAMIIGKPSQRKIEFHYSPNPPKLLTGELVTITLHRDSKEHPFRVKLRRDWGSPNTHLPSQEFDICSLEECHAMLSGCTKALEAYNNAQEELKRLEEEPL